MFFNTFINDIFILWFSYADDNTILFIRDYDLPILKNVLDQQSIFLIKWFENNFMKAYPEKFHSFEVQGIKCKGTFCYEVD